MKMTKRLLAFILIVILTISALSASVFASGFSNISTKGDELVFPREKDLQYPFRTATVKASRANGSIYFMPEPEAGHGNLGTVKHGTSVYILAKRNGYYFFVTEDGYMGWNGTKYFKLTGTASADEVYDYIDTPELEELFDGDDDYLYFLDYVGALMWQ